MKDEDFKVKKTKKKTLKSMIVADAEKKMEEGLDEEMAVQSDSDSEMKAFGETDVQV